MTSRQRLLTAPRGGSDPYPMRTQNGRQVLLMSGVGKTKLIESKAAIRQESRRLENLVADGGKHPAWRPSLPARRDLRELPLPPQTEAGGIRHPGAAAP
jgi:hypothetical protein